MSRALAVAERLPADAYVTPDLLTRAICERLRQRFTPDEVIEPSAGAGAFVRASRATWPEAHVTANEIDRGRKRELLQAGAHVVLHWDWPTIAAKIAIGQTDAGAMRLIVGNPPFRAAQEHIEAALRMMRPGDSLAFLLRLNLLGSSVRVKFWREWPPSWVAPIVPRPSFTGGGTDGTEYALFVWQGYSERRGRGSRLVAPVVWKA